MTLRVSTLDAEGVYQGSKFLKIQVLCDASDLEILFQLLKDFWIFPLSGLHDGAHIEPVRFLTEYGAWIEVLKRGGVPSDAELRRLLACALTASADALWLQQVPGGRFLTKIADPVVQVQAHFFTYSAIDGEFRSMTMGLNSVFWGLQFMLPQVYQNPKTMELLELKEGPNAELFRKIRQWSREYTRATPFVVEGRKVNVPIRLGKNCFSWIGSHLQLQKLGVGVG